MNRSDLKEKAFNVSDVLFDNIEVFCPTGQGLLFIIIFFNTSLYFLGYDNYNCTVLIIYQILIGWTGHYHCHLVYQMHHRLLDLDPDEFLSIKAKDGMSRGTQKVIKEPICPFFSLFKIKIWILRYYLPQEILKQKIFSDLFLGEVRDLMFSIDLNVLPP